MTIIPFPRARLADEIPPLERGRLIALIVGAFRSVGEPATTAELAEVLRPLIVPEARIGLRRDIEAVMRANAVPTPSPLFGCVVFRTVALEGREAWAFTETFRSLLRDGGLSTPLRAHSGFAGPRSSAETNCPTSMLSD